MHQRKPALVLGRLLRRLAAAGRRALSARMRRGRAWTCSGWQLGQAALDQRSLKRLAKLVGAFRRQGLCENPAFERVPGFGAAADIAQLPVLTRAGAIALYERLRPIYAGRHDVYVLGTGGWTGEPVHYFRSRRIDAYAYGMLVEMQSLMGWRPGMACHCLWADPRELGISHGRRNGLAGELKMVKLYGSFKPTAKHFNEFLDAVRDDPYCAVYGSPGLLLQCTHYMRDQGIRLAPGHVRAAWSTAEAMDPRLPPLFAEQFGAPLRDFYGSREAASISAECRCGNRHINSRYFVEICDPQTRAVLPDGQPGNILITDLFNDVTPLIRYEIGDRGAIEWRDCDCGRGSYVFTQLTGRPPVMIRLANGRELTPYCFLSLAQSFPAIHRVQLVRLGVSEFEYRYMGRELAPRDERQLAQLAETMAEGASVRMCHVEDIEKAASGKQRYFIDRTRGD